jgi:hypothetical protein
VIPQKRIDQNIASSFIPHLTNNMNKYSERHEKNETLKRDICGSEIRMQLGRYALLEKPSRFGPQAINQVIEECHVPVDMASSDR